MSKHRPPVYCWEFPNWFSATRDLFSHYFDFVDHPSKAKIELAIRGPVENPPHAHDRPLVWCCFWDAYLDEYTRQDGDVLHLFSRDWIFIHEHTYHNFFQSQHNQCALGQADRFMLMLMSQQRSHRDAAMVMFARMLPHSLWTYLERGIYLPEEPLTAADTRTPGAFDHRRYERQWYDRTCFSMVVESRVENRLFVSEKSFKPIAHGHPFVIFGPQGILQYLHSLGFETFDNEVNELYDTIANDSSFIPARWPYYTGYTPMPRMRAIYRELNRLHGEWFSQGRRIFTSRHTTERIRHNTDRFYYSKFVNGLFYDQIVEPILSFIERV